MSAVDPMFDPSGFAGAAGVVDGFEAGRRARAVADAAEIRLLAKAAAAVARPVGASVEAARRAELDRRVLISELATSTRTSEWTVTRLLSEAADLVDRFPTGVDALEQGTINRAHLSVIHDIGSPIDDPHARAEFTRIAVDRATTLTPARLAAALRVIVENFAEVTLAQRRAEAAARRDVEVVDLPDGLATLTLTHEATLVHGIEDRLTAQARSVITARDMIDVDEAGGEVQRDERTLGQLRADIAADVLLAAGPAECVAGSGLDAIRATVQVTVSVLTMTGASSEPCLLAGYGPIDPDTARTLAGTTPGWERVMTSPVTGCVLAVDRYRPGPALRRHLAARDEHCRFPGCRRPVWRCDIDHTTPAGKGGPTCHDNLAHLCRGHHILKTIEAWTAEQIAPGVIVWTSPTGRKHTDKPEPAVRFTPDDEILARRRLMHEPWLFTDPGTPGTTNAPPF